MSEKRECTLQFLQDQSGRTESVHITQGGKAVTPTPEPDPGHGQDPHNPDDGGGNAHDLVSPLSVVLQGVTGSGEKMIVFPDDVEITISRADFTYSVDSSHMVPTLHVTRTAKGLRVGHSSFKDERTADGGASDYQRDATITINVNGEVRRVSVKLALPPVR